MPTAGGITQQRFHNWHHIETRHLNFPISTRNISTTLKFGIPTRDSCFAACFRILRHGLGHILCRSFRCRVLVDRVDCLVWACATIPVRRHASTGADCRNTPIGLANKVLTHDVPRVVYRVDRALTGGRAGKVCGYVFSAGTPLIMVPYP